MPGSIIKILSGQRIKFMEKFLKQILILVILFFLLFPILNVEGTVSLPNLLGSTDLPTIVGNIIKAVLGLVGTLALVMFIYGGILWMTSGGSEEQVKKGKDTLVWAILGLAIIFFSYALSNFVITRLTTAAAP